MSQSQLKESYKFLGKPDQTFREYVVQEIERSRQQLEEAVNTAAKTPDGKPVFYTILRSVSRSGMSRTISVHYVERESGELCQLNYACAVILGLPMDAAREGIKIKGCGMDMGFALVYDLAAKICGDGYAINHRWI
ncbi:MAG: hypothetical protein AAFW68_08075 [Pseudomonadota bacterium]